MPRFLDELKDKAQSALNSTPLKAYVPQISQSSTPNTSTGSRSHALDAIQHQIRTLQVQYGSTASRDVRQLQLIITGLKGIVLDLDKEAQDAKSVSKEVYVWGQTEDVDLKDVTDRLAYLSYTQGCLASTLASSIDASRGPMKALRDAEVQLQPRRNIRHGYELQISNLRNANKPGTEAKIRELESMLRQAELRDEPAEKEIDLLKRKAIVESERQRWQAIREYGEKLLLLSQAAKPILDVLPSIPPTVSHPYTGAATTAAVRATLQKALDHYEPGNITLPLPIGLEVEAENRSFGETHAKELSRINSVADHRPPTPRAPSPTILSFDRKSSSESLHPVPNSNSSPTSATAIDPRSLNNAPAPIPLPESPQVIPSAKSTEAPISELSSDSIPAAVPTLAETGLPVIAGKDGPGPSSGSLAGGPRAKSESAEVEKARLQREERESLLRSGVPTGAPSASPTCESAEEEKQRSEKEERERTLYGQTTATSQHVSDETERGETEDDGNMPPPAYEEPK